MSEGTEITTDESSQASQSEGHISLTGGSSPVSFDDFESIDAAEKVQAKIEAKREKQKELLKNGKEAKDSKPKPEKQAKDKKEPEAKQSKESGDGGEASTEQKESGDEESEESKEADQKAQKVRTYKLKSGDNEVSLRSDSKLPVKSDGETHEVALQDLMNSWSGHKAVDKRLGEFGAEKQKFIEERKVIDDTIGEMAKAISEGTPQKALMKFFEALGSDPVKGIQDLKKGFLKDIDFERMATTAPEERDSVIEESSNQDYKEWYEQQQVQKQTEAQHQQLNSRILNIQREHDIDDAAFNDMAEELLQLREAGKLKEEVTPELIAQNVIFDRKLSKAQNLLGEVSPELKQDREAVEKVVSLLNARLGDDEIAQFISTKYGSSQAQPQDKLSKKFEKQSGTDGFEKGKQTPQNEDMWSFDNL